MKKTAWNGSDERRGARCFECVVVSVVGVYVCLVVMVCVGQYGGIAQW